MNVLFFFKYIQNIDFFKKVNKNNNLKVNLIKIVLFI